MVAELLCRCSIGISSETAYRTLAPDWHYLVRCVYMGPMMASRLDTRAEFQIYIEQSSSTTTFGTG
jgi:hypothetical protein